MPRVRLVLGILLCHLPLACSDGTKSPSDESQVSNGGKSSTALGGQASTTLAGAPSSGGTSSGGVSASSGGTSSGGVNVASGGTSSGGTSSGGVNVASGGTSSGGVNVASGGTSSGGVNVASGGTSSGGVASGGLASGGVASGGVSTASGGVASGGAAPNPYFVASVRYPLPARPTGIVIDDLNGDGKRDLAVSLDNAELAVLLNRGDATFGEPRRYAGAQTGLGNPLSADVTGDKKPDLLSAQGTAPYLLLLANDGDGGFPKSTPITSAQFSDQPAFGDIDADGKADLVLARLGALLWLKNQGNGTFGAPNVVPNTQNVIGSLALGDVSGDGYVDVLVRAAHAVDIFLNDGTGKLTTTSGFNFGALTVGRVAIGDVTGDKKPDIIATSTGKDDGPGAVYVLPNLGGGAFGSYQTYGSGAPPFGGGSAGLSGTGPFAFVLGDFDGNARLDLAFLNSGNNRGDPNGSLVVSVDLASTAGYARLRENCKPVTLAAGDLNGDGHDDLAAAFDSDNGVQVYLAR